MNYLQKKKLAFMSIANSVKGFVRTVIGIPPLALPYCADEKSFMNYKIYGNSVQDGTPLPDNPVELVSVGEKTINLFDENSLTIGTHYKGTYGNVSKIENGFSVTGVDLTRNFRLNLIIPSNLFEEGKTYTISATLKNVTLIWIGQADNINDTATANTFGKPSITDDINSVTFTVENLTKEYVNFYFYSNYKTTGSDELEVSCIQIQEGNTSTEHEPYGKYKIPIIARGENGESITTNIFLDKPLYGIADCADYIDFENSKVVRNIEYTGLNEKFSWRTVAAWNTANTYYFDCVNQVHNIKELIDYETPKALCNMFSAVSNTVWGKSDDTVNRFSVNAANKQFRCRVSKDIATTVDGFKNFITNNNIGIAYQMETPEEEDIILPTLPIFKGTTVYEIDTTIQPSNMEATYYSTRKGE